MALFAALFHPWQGLWLCLLVLQPVYGEIPKPNDAPKPMRPEETVASYKVPPGFRLELIASEPLLASPTGVCWGEDGRLYVSELHGYNLEGQLEIEALNQSGILDTQVRRVQAAEEYKRAALPGTYGVVKVLQDNDGDGRMDEAIVLADDLPPAYGLVPSRGGVIVACAPDIVFLADRDRDGRLDERETLFTGFGTGPLERGINAPQWGLDGWIYVGRGAGGGRITGPHLQDPELLPNSGFRIRPDGTAIEPVTGSTHTYGFAFTSSADRFVIGTTALAMQVAPIDTVYLRRNPDAAASGLQENITPGQRAFPRSSAHPWRTKRAQNKAYFQYYRSRYGASDSDASGWFTSGCSPLIYKDESIPGLRGHYLACDPAQNFIFRGILADSENSREPLMTLKRLPAETSSEFCASTDPWSHPMYLTHGPNGGVWIVDFYREIIEDYSAIPRHLQQQYGLYSGHDRGRLYRLTHEQAPAPRSAVMNDLSNSALVSELRTDLSWRRMTAQRLLRERNALDVVPALREQIRSALEPETLLTTGQLLSVWGALQWDDLSSWLSHVDSGVRIHALRLVEPWLRSNSGGQTSQVLSKIVDTRLEREQHPRVLVQLALTLGESKETTAFDALTTLARQYGDIRWMTTALASSLYEREAGMVIALMGDFGVSTAPLKTLSQILAGRGDVAAITAVISAMPVHGTPAAQSVILEAFQAIKTRSPDLSDWNQAAGDALAGLAASENDSIRDTARAFEEALFFPSSEEDTTSRRPALLDSSNLQELSPGTWESFAQALLAERNIEQGRQIFSMHCATCHQVGDLGHEVAPDLLGELEMPEETLLRQILLPHERIRPGYETTLVELQDGTAYAGILKEDGATSLTLALPEGIEQVVLRKNVVGVRRLAISLMPAVYSSDLTPKDVANLLGWLKSGGSTH